MNEREKNIMDKPLSMIIKETEMGLIHCCNESALPISILDLIVKKIYLEIHNLAEKQSAREELEYITFVESNNYDKENIDFEVDDIDETE